MKLSPNEFNPMAYIDKLLERPTASLGYDETSGRYYYMIICRTETIPELYFYFTNTPPFEMPELKALPDLSKKFRHRNRRANEINDALMDPYIPTVSSMEELTEALVPSKLRNRVSSFAFHYLHEF